MSTDFTLYALPADALVAAQRYASTSLGYGNTSMAAVATAAMVADHAGDRFSIFDREDVGRFIVEEHTSFCDGAEGGCMSHRFVEAIGNDFPLITVALEYRLRDLVGFDYAGAGTVWTGKRADGLFDHRPMTPSEWRSALSGFLYGAMGRRLWYVFV